MQIIFNKKYSLIFWTVATAITFLTLFISRQTKEQQDGDADQWSLQLKTIKYETKNVNLNSRKKIKEETDANNVNDIIPNKKFMKTICELDQSKTLLLEQINISTLQEYQLKVTFHSFIQDPWNMACLSKQRFGGEFNVVCEYTDGAKFACMDDFMYDLNNNECLIFSFGISGDWSFEDTLDEMGCKIYAFDPSVDYPIKRGKNIHFEKLGVAYKADKNPEFRLETLSNILKKYNHENSKISYLKADIEGAELKGLPHWLSSGALKNVQQIGLELHLHNDYDGDQHKSMFKFLQKLCIENDFRLISYDPNGCYSKSTNYFALFEIVLKRINQKQKNIEKNCNVFAST